MAADTAEVQSTKSVKFHERWGDRTRKMLIATVVISFFLRFFLVNDPPEVVFDEVHFGGFASNYLRREYFFDVHPPLGKLLIAGVGWLFGYDGSFSFGKIGLSYAGSTAPYVALRTFMVLLGTAISALSFASMIALGFGDYAAGMTGLLVAFDNASILQSRLILLDSMLIFFITLSLYSWIKFRQYRSAPFSPAWMGWLFMTGFGIGCASSVKMVGLLTVATIGLATIFDLWELADSKRGLSEGKIAIHFGWRALALIVFPLFIFAANYYVHFAVLTRTGPGDDFMSSEFQATLEGSTMSAKSRKLLYGHTIRLKSRMEETYLHSHPHKYPRVHDDGKVSSEGQQVTGYPKADPNNIWKVVPVTDSDSGNKAAEEVSSDDVPLDGQPVESGDRVRLLHVASGKYLKTHDVASPLTKTNMEVTVIDLDDPNVKEAEKKCTVWIMDIDGKNKNGHMVRAHAHNILLKNEVHKVYLNNHQMPLPKWGFNQREINGDKRGVSKTCRWIIWDIMEPIDDKEAEEMRDLPIPKMNFIQKMIELSKAQVAHNANLVDNHPFKSDPITWPFVLRGISYWDRKDGFSRLYLLGNPIAWYVCLIGMVAWGVAAFKHAYYTHRGYATYSDNQFHRRFLYRTLFLFTAYLLHYLPFFTMSRSLYLHHYLPAYLISAMITGAVFDFYHSRLTPNTLGARLFPVFSVVIAGAVIAAFFYLSPLTYGTSIHRDILRARKWIGKYDWP